MGALRMKTSSWNHPAARRATLTTAQNTCGATECNAVKAAWTTIGVPAQSGETDCGGTTTPDFTLALNPTTGSVELSASGAPSGVNVSFSPFR
ncbi:hypothetical protein OG372_31965 [Streptomyces sp. NBC_01020]|uniref:hypothetical protein n=1 Tax=unclassified Streptomyces TaxID=2593676 RepID=UPI00324F8DEF|nr:hypothetical protein OG372_31965 [Streptomyces sp. NBC_01020]WSX66032.1 hypothetical protein OG221_05040 [Streptomyces sp. NBC_00932]